jgi:DNA/RNA-binding domain of Phe-tRNA-synthetase-like protein
VNLPDQPSNRLATLDGIPIAISADHVVAGIIVGRGCHPGSSTETLNAAIDTAVAEARRQADPRHMTTAVRDVLRHGKYKPTGRGKPASEYLLNAAREERFPRLGTLVDINNLISLRSRLPISLIDLERAAATGFLIRHGRPGESYVFNRAGQRIDLEDLLLVARLPEDRPCANAVKDSMETRLTERSRDVMAVIYAPPALHDELAEAAAQFGRALGTWGGAASVATAVVGRDRKLP